MTVSGSSEWVVRPARLHFDQNVAQPAQCRDMPTAVREQQLAHGRRGGLQALQRVGHAGDGKRSSIASSRAGHSGGRAHVDTLRQSS